MANDIIEGEYKLKKGIDLQGEREPESQELALMRMENDQIFSVARMAPRQPMVVVKMLQELIDAFPAAADEAVYRKPVGTVTQITCGKCGIKYEVNFVDNSTACPACDCSEAVQRKDVRKIKKFAEGLSIRAAENIRSIWGYTRLATTTEILEDGRAVITGTLVDYAAGNMTTDSRIVSPWYKKSGSTEMARTPEDRFLGVVVKAEKSKLRRDLILDNTPSIVKAMFRSACEEKMKALVAPEVVEQKIIPAFQEFGIGPDLLDKIIGKPHALGWSEQEKLQCRKILAGLHSGDVSIQDLVAANQEQTAAPKAGSDGPKTAAERARKLAESSSSASGPLRTAAKMAAAVDPGKPEPGPTARAAKPDVAPAAEAESETDSRQSEIDALRFDIDSLTTPEEGLKLAERAIALGLDGALDEKIKALRGAPKKRSKSVQPDLLS